MGRPRPPQKQCTQVVSLGSAAAGMGTRCGSSPRGPGCRSQPKCSCLGLQAGEGARQGRPGVTHCQLGGGPLPSGHMSGMCAGLVAGG